MTHDHELDCQDILRDLNAYIDGELDAVLCGDIETHLRTCKNCQIVVNTLKKTIHLYQADGQETNLPEDVRLRLFATLDLENDAENDG